jgi:coproporphyrinogen III oxidase-like Fe-S oxidoreductase
MRLTGHNAFKFDGFMPLYNWIYPIAGDPVIHVDEARLTALLRHAPTTKSRALYFHIPFCETICSFCPFVRHEYDSASVMDEYVSAIIREIRFKGSFTAFTTVPVGAIFFGGGTPSLLEPHHILALGAAIRETFDLSSLREFSFEFEVKSVTPEKIDALRSIGVTHARFGLQTLSERYRRHFRLTATKHHIEYAVPLLMGAFPYVSCDVLYGMNGQTEDELLDDIDGACGLGLNNLDFYPINDLVTQPSLHKSFRTEDMRQTSELTKFYMRLALRQALKEKNFLPHNGHGWVRVSEQQAQANPVLTSDYSFVYHEHTMGYSDHDLLGFGANAISSFQGFTMTNTPSLRKYIEAPASLSEVAISEHRTELDACKPLCLALPYHGTINISEINWSYIPSIIRERIIRLEAERLIKSDGDTISLTALGWEWYTSIMYYLLPPVEQQAIQQVIYGALSNTQKTAVSCPLRLVRAGESTRV